MTFITEQRTLGLGAGVQLREDPSGGAPTFAGHATVFDQRYAIGNPLTWGFYEQVSASAADKTIAEGDQRFLVNHDTGLVVSRVSAGTLKLSADAVGVAVESANLNTRKSYVADLVENLRDGSITGMSMGFRVVKDDWTTETVETSDGMSAEIEVRTILEMDLLEVSAVTFPANDATDAALRGEQRQVADALIRRGDLAAFERRCAAIPALETFRYLFEPREAGIASLEPEGLTEAELALRMRGLSARYLL